MSRWDVLMTFGNKHCSELTVTDEIKLQMYTKTLKTNGRKKLAITLRLLALAGYGVWPWRKFLLLAVLPCTQCKAVTV